MPITNDGRIYIDTTTTPHKGVSIADIQAALRTGASNDIGGLIQYAWAHDMINRWAKYKPFRDNSFNPTDLTRKSKGYGLFFPWYNRIGTMVQDIYDGVWTHAENYDALRAPWEWEPPRGFSVTPKEPYRFPDFDRYYANAQPFVSPVSGPVVIPVGDHAATFFWPYVYDEQAIAPSDIVPGIDATITRYLGVCLFTGVQGNQRKVYTLAEVSHYDDYNIHLIEGDWGHASVGTYHAFLFISDRQIALGDTEAVGEYTPILPSISTVVVSLEQWKLRNLVIEAEQLSRTVTVAWVVDLQNNRGTTATVECHYYYMDANNQEQELLPSYSQQVNLQAGTNAGNCDKSGVDWIISRVVVSITIYDATHGNEHINGEAYPTPL